MTWIFATEQSGTRRASLHDDGRVAELAFEPVKPGHPRDDATSWMKIIAFRDGALNARLASATQNAPALVR